jgi:very-short-patch-repair endonuclease
VENTVLPISTVPEAPLARERLAKLFEFLKAYTDLRYPPVRDLSQQPHFFWLQDLPTDTSVERTRAITTPASDENAEDAGIILRLTRPVCTPCPPPHEDIADWLKPGWQEFIAKAEFLPARETKDDRGLSRIDKFETDERRLTRLRAWLAQRDAWIARERPVRQALDLFQRAYEWYGVLEREGERIELLVGDGLLHCPDTTGDFRHPVLLQKLTLEFYPDTPQPCFVFRKQEHPPELYMELLRVLPGINNQQLAQCSDELKRMEFSPLGGDDTDAFLRRLIQGLFPGAGTVSTPGQSAATPTITRQPAIFMRVRRSGPGNVFDLVLEDIHKRQDALPPSLLRILGFFPPDAELVDDSLAPISASGNEDDDILLSKPANREQLEIARQLERKDCVLVQGPPGTGKTHTIANLLGHLLAQGKRVLVTAHTPKALRVLREKVVEPLRPLCVSVLHNDKPSQEELQASVRTIHTKLSQDNVVLEREARRLQSERTRVLIALREARARLLEARMDEIRDVVFEGVVFRPVDAARHVREAAAQDNWIPGPVTLGAPLPLSPAEIVSLYQANTRISLADEREIVLARPDLEKIATPSEFKDTVEARDQLGRQHLRFREELWGEPACTVEPAAFERLFDQAGRAIAFLRESTPWQLEAIQAGRDGKQARRVWESFAEHIENIWKEVQECHALVMEHGPEISDPRAPRELLPVVDEIIARHESGRSFGVLTKLTKRAWFELQETTKIGGRALDLTNVQQVRAVRAVLRQRQLRAELVERWERYMSGRGGLPAADLSERPEQVCRQFVPQIRASLNWHACVWLLLEAEFNRLGFRWNAFLESTPPESGENADLRRLRRAIVDNLGPVLETRANRLRHEKLQARIQAWCAQLIETPRDAQATRRLRQAATEASPEAYQEAYDELARLNTLEPELISRRESLEKLAGTAPAWASALENRVPPHDDPQPPGDPRHAWQWRQLHDELEVRAAVSLDSLQARIEQLSTDLREVTTQLVEKQTWLHRLVKTGSPQKQALGAYAALRNKITKTGKGVRDAENRAAARREMAVAKDAVPVWIMPLAEVAETFDPRTARFDVVIVDEASQCDPTSLFALYLGRQTIIVGDDEQVTPIAIGTQSEDVSKLVSIFLDGVPHKELYDGETSVYELAQIAFGGVIRLTEHFRCAPDIIGFSNHLSYKGEIQPLRESSAVPLRPHVVFLHVPEGRARAGEVNDIEAETVASLICAAHELPEFAKNDRGTPVSFGVVSLVGDKQAVKIDALLRRHLTPAAYKQRQILCGDAAQFQGDERDVMFLSVVDGPPAHPPLPIRQEGPKKVFKKRFNVAASRARNQMWVVHSLNHETDLQPGDYRRRLIEHALYPQGFEPRIDSPDAATPGFEEQVRRHLLARNFQVLSDYRAGACALDLVVIGANGRRLAVECDGSRFHGPEQLEADMERQSVLERLGWKFVRIRSSLFFRDEERALVPLFRRLHELGIEPHATAAPGKPAPAADKSKSLVDKVTQRAAALRKTWSADE